MNFSLIDAHFKLVADNQVGVGSYFFGYEYQLNTDNLEVDGQVKEYPVIQWAPAAEPDGKQWLQDIHSKNARWNEFILFCWRPMEYDNANQTITADTKAAGWDETERLLYHFVKKAFATNNPAGILINTPHKIEINKGSHEHNDRLIATRFHFLARTVYVCDDGVFGPGVTW